jgi:hypothetical protein
VEGPAVASVRVPVVPQLPYRTVITGSTVRQIGRSYRENDLTLDFCSPAARVRRALSGPWPVAGPRRQARGAGRVLHRSRVGAKDRFRVRESYLPLMLSYLRSELL